MRKSMIVDAINSCGKVVYLLKCETKRNKLTYFKRASLYIYLLKDETKVKIDRKQDKIFATKKR